jgi:hypothetical protein
MKKITKILVLASIVIASACSTSTKIVGSWTNKEQKITQFEKSWNCSALSKRIEQVFN